MVPGSAHLGAGQSRSGTAQSPRCALLLQVESSARGLTAVSKAGTEIMPVTLGYWDIRGVSERLGPQVGRAQGQHKGRCPTGFS